MDTINGIDFENWAAACAHLAQGTSEDDVCKTLGIEMPVWQDTNEKWAAKLGDMMAQDMNVATQYGDIFANPKIGKFANSESNIPTIDELLQQVPDTDAYKKIFWQQSIAAQHGIDPVSVLEDNGLNLQTWGQLNMHYIKHNNAYMNSELSDTNPDEYNRRYQETMAIDNKWQNHWNEHYKDNAVDLTGDIDF